jgi:hypothetical protein
MLLERFVVVVTVLDYLQKEKPNYKNPPDCAHNQDEGA